MNNTKVFYSDSELKIKTAEHHLNVAGIECIVLNKKDSAYSGILGHIELHVPVDDVEKAREILKNAEII